MYVMGILKLEKRETEETLEVRNFEKLWMKLLKSKMTEISPN